jgi:hypothetical protein
MRVNNYINERKITLSILNLVCEYLYVNQLQINTKISDEYVILFDETLKCKTFKEWYQSKIRFHKSVNFRNANRLISLLNYNSSSEINEITGLRTINSIKYFIKIGRFSANKTEITNIVESKKDILNKISELRNIRPFRKPTESDLKKFQEFDNLNLESKVEIDPYENFHFGGLSGEEAHTAYWNCD